MVADLMDLLGTLSTFLFLDLVLEDHLVREAHPPLARVLPGEHRRTPRHFTSRKSQLFSNFYYSQLMSHNCSQLDTLTDVLRCASSP